MLRSCLSYAPTRSPGLTAVLAVASSTVTAAPCTIPSGAVSLAPCARLQASQPAYYVPEYLQGVGVKIIPVPGNTQIRPRCINSAQCAVPHADACACCKACRPGAAGAASCFRCLPHPAVACLRLVHSTNLSVLHAWAACRAGSTAWHLIAAELYATPALLHSAVTSLLPFCRDQLSWQLSPSRPFSFPHLHHLVPLFRHIFLSPSRLIPTVYYPEVKEILGEPVVRQLRAIKQQVDILDVFRRPQDLPQASPRAAVCGAVGGTPLAAGFAAMCCLAPEPKLHVHVGNWWWVAL